jgi:D-alanine-D-alanine ligase
MVKKRRVALLFGGRSAEHEVSLVSAASVYKNLDQKKYDVSSVYINKQGSWRCVSSPLLSPQELRKGKFFPFLPWGAEGGPFPSLDADIYFPALHGPCGEDGTIQGLFEMADVPFVGAAVLGSAISMDKAVAKCLFKIKKLPVVKHLVFSESSWVKQPEKVLEQISENTSLPFFIKPANLGSSIGITKVKNFDETGQALRTAFLYDAKVLVEEAILGREIECSVLGNAYPRASLPGEIFPYREFYDYRDKYEEGKTSFGIPADLSPEITQEIQRLAIEAFTAVDCSGMARVDFFLQNRPRKIFLNEINTIPGFTEISMYPKLWEVSGLPYPRLLDELINLGFERHQNKKRKGVLFKP